MIPAAADIGEIVRHDHAYVGLIAEVSALVQNNKTGSIFIFDRATGKPLVPIVERMYGTTMGDSVVAYKLER